MGGLSLVIHLDSGAGACGVESEEGQEVTFSSK
jgi:hypothetical protein